MISEELKKKINRLIGSLIEKNIDDATIQSVVSSIVRYRENEINSRENAMPSLNTTVNVLPVLSLSKTSVASREVKILQEGVDSCSIDVDSRRFANRFLEQNFWTLNSRLFKNIGTLSTDLSRDEMAELVRAIKNKALLPDVNCDFDPNLSSSSSSPSFS